MIINTAIFHEGDENLVYILDCLSSLCKSHSIELRTTLYHSSSDLIKHHADLDLVIFDIDKEDQKGLAFGSMLKQAQPTLHCVYMSKSDTYMKEAFRMNQFNFILKRTMKYDLPIVLENIIKDFNTRLFNSFTLKTEYGKTEVNSADIICIQYVKRKPVLYMKQASLVASGHSLKSIYNCLNPSFFIRPSSSTIVNMEYIKSMKKDSINLDNFDSAIHISRGRYTEIRNQYLEYCLKMTQHTQS